MTKWRWARNWRLATTLLRQLSNQTLATVTAVGYSKQRCTGLVYCSRTAENTFILEKRREKPKFFDAAVVRGERGKEGQTARRATEARVT